MRARPFPFLCSAGQQLLHYSSLQPANVCPRLLIHKCVSGCQRLYGLEVMICFCVCIYMYRENRIRLNWKKLCRTHSIHLFPHPPWPGVSAADCAHIQKIHTSDSYAVDANDCPNALRQYKPHGTWTDTLLHCCASICAGVNTATEIPMTRLPGRKTRVCAINRI